MRTPSQHVYEVTHHPTGMVRMFRQAASAAKYVATLDGEFTVTIKTDGKIESYNAKHYGVITDDQRRKMAYATMLTYRERLDRQ